MKLLKAVDNLFLGRELSEASRLNSRLKAAITANQSTVQRLEIDAANLRAKVVELHEEIGSLERQKGEIVRELEALQHQLTRKQQATAATIAKLTVDVNRDRNYLLGKLNREIESAREVGLAQVRTEIEERRLAIEAKLHAGATDTANRLQNEHQQLKDRLKKASVALQAAYEGQQQTLANEYADKMKSLKESHSQAAAGLDADLQKRKDALSQVETELAQTWATAQAEIERRANDLQEQLQHKIDLRKAELEILEGQIKDRLKLAEAEEAERIEVMRRAFKVEQDAAILELRSEQLEANETLKQSKAQIIEEYRGAIEQPLLEEIAALTIELGRVKKKISKENMNWQPGQIREFFVKEREGRAEPTHVRIGGASESGKSYMINQLISGGLASMGVEAVDFFLLDPYGSDTKWDIKPSVYDDAERAAEVVRDWGKNAKGDKLPRPTILMIDEFDTLVAQFDLAQAVKDVVKLGRHRNRFLWMVGQSGNCPKGFTWTDVKNLNQLYLGSVAEDYVNNGLKGRNKNKFLGEIEALREKSKFHAIVTPKDRNPYTVLIPAQLFPDVAVSMTADDESPGDAVLKCSKCGSSDVKKDGTYKYKEMLKQRLKCGACGKGSSVPME